MCRDRLERVLPVLVVLVMMDWADRMAANGWLTDCSEE